MTKKGFFGGLRHACRELLRGVIVLALITLAAWPTWDPISQRVAGQKFTVWVSKKLEHYSNAAASGILHPVGRERPEPRSEKPAEILTPALHVQSDLSLEALPARVAELPKVPVEVADAEDLLPLPSIELKAPIVGSAHVPLPRLRPKKKTAVPALSSDPHTAVYDISAHLVYMPDGTSLEAHSGAGRRMDDPTQVYAKDLGPTPPNIYDLTLRPGSFHGIEAIRLNPVDKKKMYGRVGILAHPYMLGSAGQSNGCVSFKDYDAFLNAFKSGEVNRLMVVQRLERDVPLVVAAQTRREVPSPFSFILKAMGIKTDVR